MTVKLLATIALVAFVLTSSARIYNTNLHGADISQLATNSPPAKAVAVSGRTLFLRNCAHCHGADAHGDDGPDLHDIGWTDRKIATRIRKGKAGQMTAFAGKLQPAEIDALVRYVESLK
jgi:mono/diheme cytochrome c family protein